MKLEVAIKNEEQSSKRLILVDDSMKLTDFLDKHQVSGPFVKYEIEYSVTGEDETFSEMIKDLGIDKISRVYFKKLLNPAVTDATTSNASELRLKITIENGKQDSKLLYVDASTRLADFIKSEQVFGPFVKSDDSEIEYSVNGNEETFLTMMTGLNMKAKKEEFEKSIYFKKLSQEQVMERSKKEALLKFEKERDIKRNQLKERIEDIKKLIDQVERLTSRDDEFLKDFEKLKLNNGIKVSDFSGISTKGEAISAIKSLEEELRKYEYASNEKLEMNFSLENKCLSLLNSCAPHGIVFEDIDEPNIVNFSDSKTRNFHSIDHWEENNRRRLCKINKLAAEGEVAEGFSLTQVGSNYIDGNCSAEETDLSQERISEETQFVVSMESVNQLLKFKVKRARLTSIAEEAVREIARESEIGNIERVKDFFKDYPEKINFGPFGVGGRFEIIAITTSFEKVAVDKLYTAAYKHLDHDVKAVFSLGTITAGGSGSVEIHKDSVETKRRGLLSGASTTELKTQVEKYCYGPRVTNQDDLYKILHLDPQTWTIFPSPDGSNSVNRFVPIYTVIKYMAKQKEDDQELLDAAEILKKFLEEQEHEDWKKRQDEVKKREEKALEAALKGQYKPLKGPKQLNFSNRHPTQNYWRSGKERKVKCSSCGSELSGIEYVADMFDGYDTKCYIFYCFAKQEVKTEVGIAKDDEEGRRVFIGDLRVTIKAGSPLVKVFRRKGHDHQCSFCFERTFPDVFADVCSQLSDMAAITNYDSKLHKKSYGERKVVQAYVNPSSDKTCVIS